MFHAAKCHLAAEVTVTPQSPKDTLFYAATRKTEGYGLMVGPRGGTGFGSTQYIRNVLGMKLLIMTSPKKWCPKTC